MIHSTGSAPSIQNIPANVFSENYHWLSGNGEWRYPVGQSVSQQFYENTIRHMISITWILFDDIHSTWILLEYIRNLGSPSFSASLHSHKGVGLGNGHGKRIIRQKSNCLLLNWADPMAWVREKNIWTLALNRRDKPHKLSVRTPLVEFDLPLWNNRQFKPNIRQLCWCFIAHILKIQQNYVQ